MSGQTRCIGIFCDAGVCPHDVPLFGTTREYVFSVRVEFTVHDGGLCDWAIRPGKGWGPPATPENKLKKDDLIDKLKLLLCREAFETRLKQLAMRHKKEKEEMQAKHDQEVSVYFKEGYLETTFRTREILESEYVNKQ